MSEKSRSKRESKPKPSKKTAGKRRAPPAQRAHPTATPEQNECCSNEDEARPFRSRFRILTAFALGDALGSRFEQQVEGPHPSLLARGGQRLSLFDSPTGRTLDRARPTDDTVLMLGFAKHLLPFQSAAAEPPPYSGNLYRLVADPNERSRGWGGSLARAAEQRAPVISGGCGALMRVAPLAFWATSATPDTMWRIIATQVAATHLGVEHVVWSWIYVQVLADAMMYFTSDNRVNASRFRHRLRCLKHEVLTHYLVEDGCNASLRDVLFRAPKGSVSNVSVMAHSVFDCIERLLENDERLLSLNDVATEAVLLGGDCDTRAALVCPFFAQLDGTFDGLEFLEELSTIESDMLAAAGARGPL